MTFAGNEVSTTMIADIFDDDNSETVKENTNEMMQLLMRTRPTKIQ